MSDTGRTTPLYDWHRANGGNLVDFSGWTMPLWYRSGAVEEHRCVITRAGLFDTSHMDMLRVDGPDAFETLQHCFTKDLAGCVGPGLKPLTSGRCVYGAFLDESGNCLDDAIVYQLDAARYMVVVNAGMGEAIRGHLERNRSGAAVEILVISDRIGKIDLQGPLAARILKGLLRNPKEAYDGLAYFSFKGHYEAGPSAAGEVETIDGAPLMLSRTGYTGEFGFELILERTRMVGLWEAILAAGQPLGLLPCGLAARDSLRAGAVLPLSHQDIGHWPFINHPWMFALPFKTGQEDFSKSFIGDGVLAKRGVAEHTHSYIGFDPRKVSHGALVINEEGETIGTVLTCVADMAIDRVAGRIYSLGSPDRPKDFNPRGLVCGFVKVAGKLSEGQSLTLKDERRSIKVVVAADIRPNRTARRPMKEMI